VQPPFRRRLLLRRFGATAVEAELEDHIHHVAVTVTHDAQVVTRVEGRGVRLPWSICDQAGAQLAELEGRPVGATPATADASVHCTHLLECAASAVRFAGGTETFRRYDLRVDVHDDDRATATGRSSTGTELILETDGRTILAPPSFAGRSLGRGFAEWAAGELDPERFELAVQLRRAIWMRKSTTIDLDRYAVLEDLGVTAGTCFARQPQRIHLATRRRGSTLRRLPDPG
jgi:hypothetical protein